MKKIFMPAMLALLLFTAGCEQPPDNPPDKPAPTKPEVKPDNKPAPPTKPEPKKPSKPEQKPSEKQEQGEKYMDIKVYYPDDSGMKLVEVDREIVFSDENDKYFAAVETLLDDPQEANLTKIFPNNASILGVTVYDGMATVDFGGNLRKNFVGGSTGEEFLIGSVVNTLTNFPEVKCVKFLVDGQEVETLSGHMDLSMPIERMSDLTE